MRPQHPLRRETSSKALRRVARCLVLALTAAGLWAAAPSPAVGARFDTLAVGRQTYRDVEVRAVNAHSVVIRHAGGLASVPLRELDADLQARFGYSPEAEQAAAVKAQEDRQTVEARLAREREERARRREATMTSSFEKMLQRFGEPAAPAEAVDLRPRFFELSLGVKDQGRRPSCAVFAMVSALEFQNAALAGSAEKLSEEYLIWATRRVTRRTPVAGAAEVAGDADEGFSLPEVVAALRTYGIPLQDSMPNTFGTRMAAIADPPPEIVEEARTRRRVSFHLLTGRDPETQVNNIVHALDAGVPVVIGVRWPHHRTLRSGYLSEQKPLQDYAHAVTLVGYTSPTRRIEDAVFVFKNSYGVRWGQGGYGRATYRYLKQHLLHAVLIEVQRGVGEGGRAGLGRSN